MKIELDRWVRFLLGGGVNTLFTYIIFLVMNQVASYQAAYLIAYISGIVIAFFINSVFVFKVKTTWSSFFRYPLINIVNYVLSALLLGLLVEYLQLNESIAPLFVVVSIIPITYVLNKIVLIRGIM